jgi:hypothetical protein
VTLIYTAGRRVWRIRVLLVLSFAFAAWFVVWGVDLYRTYGLRPADGGVLAPLGVRVAWLAFMSVFGVGTFLGIWAYTRVYIATMWLDPASGQVAIQTIGGPWGTRHVVPRADVRATGFDSGEFYTPRMAVKAPWYTVRVLGRSGSLILDAQGTAVDERLLVDVLRGK